MRSLALTLWLVLAAPSWAQDTNDVASIISEQLEAFEERDVDRAFTYASPMIKGLFQTSEVFGQMVELGYPMIWDNHDVRFLEQREFEEGRVVLQRVMIRDLAWALHLVEYQMIQLPQGWRINGVQVLEPPEVGV